MSYMTISNMRNDPSLRERLHGCAAREGVRDPETWVAANIWQIVGNAEMEEKYQYALDTSVPSPGADEGVISDAVILAHLQPLVQVTP